MSSKEKPTGTTTTTADVEGFSSTSESRPLDTTNWIYRSRKIGPVTLPYYASPISQLIIVAFVCFLCPGMFNALNGIGGGGLVDPTVSENASIALYTTFAVGAFFAGTFTNRVGIKTTLCCGGFGYALYSGSYLCYNHTQNAGFVIFAGAILGLCAALLWTAQGAIMMSYPAEKDKGKFVSIFWMIFNLGAVIGSLIPLIQTLHTKDAQAVGDGTYIGFLVLMLCGAFLTWALANIHKVVREDGSRVIAVQHPSWKSEFFGLWEVIRSEPWFALFFPMFLASNFFYSYQFNDVNGALFNVRTRSLNGLLYWSAQILGAGVFGYALDLSRFRRSTRARLGLILVTLLTIGIWGGGLASQLQYSEHTLRPAANKIDWTDSDYAPRCVLYICYGLFDAIWQTYVYWLMGSLTNNARKLAIYAGFYKSIQSAGSAVAFGLDTTHVSYIGIFGTNWGLLLLGCLCAAPIAWFKVNDHSSVEKDVEFSDETNVQKFEQANK